MRTLAIAAALSFIAAPVMAQSNEAYIDQANQNNAATVTQDGSSNDVGLGQGMYMGVDFTVGLATVFPYPTLDEASGAANGNTATISQVGSRNAVGMFQGVGEEPVGSGNTAIAVNNVTVVNQDGDRNVAAPGQGTYGGEARVNTARIDQTGIANRVDAAQGTGQGAFSRDNMADIDQVGDRNTATVLQGRSFGGVAGSSMNNFAKSFQDGDDNESLIEQGRAGSASNSEARVFQGLGGFAADNYAEISQLGTWHTARVEQLGASHSADIDQIGTTNTATVTQSN